MGEGNLLAGTGPANAPGVGRWRDLGFVLPYGLTLLPWAAGALAARGWHADACAWLTLFVIFGVLPLLDRLLGLDPANLDALQAKAAEERRYFRIMTMLALPAWLAVLAWSAWQFASLPLGAGGELGWILSTGILGGVLAINPAHELIHKATRLERTIGGILLTCVGYHGFKIEHIRGHHVHVATPDDASSARLGESAYRFVPRALVRNVRKAWQFEAARLRRAGRSPFSLRNEMTCWTLLWLALLAAFTAWLGIAGAVFFVAQGLAAAATLEVINYVEHYGLSRREIAPGRYERVTHLHSWNASQRLSNWLLFNLQRHSDHHAHAWRRYQTLLHHDDSPQLPAGYATMFVLALVPPLWRHVMDPCARRAAEIRDTAAPA
jgi:alkane 1-monooxygenase